MIRVEGLCKHFGGIAALSGVSLEVPRGACHALMGENGAGKSTLGKILAGIHQPDQGRVLIDGEACTLRSPADAAARGVAMVHQELAFCPDLSVAENLSLGDMPRRKAWWGGRLVDRPALARRAREKLAAIGVEMDVGQAMGELSTAQEQLVQIAAAVGTGARVLLFDEPTSSLSDAEAEQLFALMERLRSEGVTMIYVSHRMPEVLRLCDRIHVLRDGQLLGSLDRDEADEGSLVRLMLGRDVKAFVPKHCERAPGEVLLEVCGLSSPAGFQDVSFDLRSGEVLGLAGLVGAGRSALLEALFGLDADVRGQVLIGGTPLPLADVQASMRAGLGLVPEDRKRQGLVLGMGIVPNQSLGATDRHRRGLFLDGRAEREHAARALDAVHLKASSLAAPVGDLSGGNQQKVVLSRWLDRDLKVLMVDEPTRGVDVGAKAALHELLDELACAGVAVLLVSSELPEVLGLSTRVGVLRDGRLCGLWDRSEATPERVLAAMAGSRDP